ncbi:MAG: PilZ domain-containing protein [Terriglobales bacterium]
MILQTLLSSKDDLTAETLIQVLSQFGIAVDRSNAADVALGRLAEERFDQVIVDFDEPEAASSLLQACRRLASSGHNLPVTVALLQDASQIRSILGEGTHFILTKPVAAEQAVNTFRAATALLKRERRQSLRVAVQAPVSLHVDDSSSVEAILLDLSIGGMDVLAAKPLPIATVAQVSFELPGGAASITGSAEVAWTNANGQMGLRFLDIDAKLRQEMEGWLTARSQDAVIDEPAAASPSRLTDLSLGGCYVETESPFPQSSAVDLCLRAPGMEIHTQGLVRVMHPGHGMGIEFPARTEEQRKSVGDFIDFLTGQPGATPQLEISARALVANAADLTRDLSQAAGDGSDAEDPLLELLRTGNPLAEEAFLAELHRQRTPAGVQQ